MHARSNKTKQNKKNLIKIKINTGIYFANYYDLRNEFSQFLVFSVLS